MADDENAKRTPTKDSPETSQEDPWARLPPDPFASAFEVDDLDEGSWPGAEGLLSLEPAQLENWHKDSPGTPKGRPPSVDPFDSLDAPPWVPDEPRRPADPVFASLEAALEPSTWPPETSAAWPSRSEDELPELSTLDPRAPEARLIEDPFDALDPFDEEEPPLSVALFEPLRQPLPLTEPSPVVPVSQRIDEDEDLASQELPFALDDASELPFELELVSAVLAVGDSPASPSSLESLSREEIELTLAEPANAHPSLGVALPPERGEDELSGLRLTLRAAISVEPSPERRAFLLTELAVLAGRAGQPATALVALEAAERLDPSFDLPRLLALGLGGQSVKGGRGASAALEVQGFEALSKGENKRAAELLVEAQALSPRALSPVLGVLWLRYQQPDWAAAAGQLTRALSLVEGDEIWGLLALERARLAERVDPEQEGPLLEAALSRVGATPALLARVERVALAKGDNELLLSGFKARLDAAHAAYRTGRASEEQLKIAVTEALCGAATVQERLGRLEEALRELHSALQWAKDDPYILARAAELSRRLGRSDAHRAHLEQLARGATSPEEAARFWYQVGLLTGEIHGEEAAAADFERAVEALPSFTPALAALGRRAVERGGAAELEARYGEEIARLEEALREGSKSRQGALRQGLSERLYRLARLVEPREPQRARALHQRALAVEPTFGPSAEALDRALARAGQVSSRIRLRLELAEQRPPEEAAELFVEAADLARFELDDAGEDGLRNAARLLARALSLVPDHAYAQRRAVEALAELGDDAARFEVELSWGRGQRGHLADERLLSAASLRLKLGDEESAAAAALPLFTAVLKRTSLLPAALLGLVTAALRLRRGDLLAATARALTPAHLASPIAAATLLDALLTLGEDAAAVDVVRRLPDPALPGLDTLCRLVLSRGGRLDEVAASLEEEARGVEGPARARLLCRAAFVGDILTPPPGDAFSGPRPDVRGALKALARRMGLGRPSSNGVDALLEAHRASIEARPAAVVRAAELLGIRPSTLMGDALAQAKESPGSAQRAVLTALGRGDVGALGAAVARLEAEDPSSILAAVARRARAARAGDGVGLAAATRALAERLVSPALSREVWQQASEAALAVGDLAGARLTLEQALLGRPGDEALVDKLADILEETEALPELIQLLTAELERAEGARHLRLSRRLAARLSQDDPAAAVVLLVDAARRRGGEEGALALLQAAALQGEDARDLYMEALALCPQPSPALALCLARPLVKREPAVAGALLERLLTQEPTHEEALALLVDARAALQDWVGVADALRRRFAAARDPKDRAEHAFALGEVLSRTTADRRKAAGWFKRAVELAPATLPYVWRFLSEVNTLSPDVIPAEHVADALDRAIAAKRQALLTEGPSGALLGELARLFHRRGQSVACVLACEAAVALGEADAASRRIYEHSPRPPTPDLGRWPQVEHPGEAAGGALRAHAEALIQALAPQAVDGRPTPLAETFRPLVEELCWHLKVGPVELLEGGALALKLSHPPALVAPWSAWSSPHDPEVRFQIARCLDGLRFGRALLWEVGALEVQSALDDGTTVEALERLESAALQTGVRVGLLASGALGVAVRALKAERLDAVGQLLNFALSSRYLSLLEGA